MLKTTLLDWLNEIDSKLNLTLPGEESYITLRVWNNSGASIVNLTDLINMSKSLRSNLESVNDEDGEILNIRNDTIYLFGLVTNMEVI